MTESRLLALEEVLETASREGHNILFAIPEFFYGRQEDSTYDLIFYSTDKEKIYSINTTTQVIPVLSNRKIRRLLETHRQSDKTLPSITVGENSPPLKFYEITRSGKIQLPLYTTTTPQLQTKFSEEGLDIHEILETEKRKIITSY